MSYILLDKINSPEDLRKLKIKQLPQVCEELRDYIIEVLSEHPGHLGSSLGAIELTVAIHYVYNTPSDRLIWDVGHQAYGHKILTGRKEAFKTNRQFKGLRPFPSPCESEYDSFTCGHASNSISAALGMAVAEKLLSQGKKENHVVAVIGDGAMSGGLAFEGLNNVSSQPNDMLIILNDNNMSIDHSVGGIKDFLLHLNTNERYNRWRFKAAKWLFYKGFLDEKRRRSILRFSNAIKSFISRQQNIFVGMDIRYFGPYDGHNVIELVRVLKEIKEMTGPKLLHLHTIKGKGYKPAEENATVWHAPGKFDLDTGERIKVLDNQTLKYQDVFGHTLLELAEKNTKIVGITPAMPTGCSMNIMMQILPERTFDVGIAEGHAVTFSAGLAKEGMQPYCNIYSSFAQRAYDNIIHDVAIQNLPVVICLDRAGIVGEDGPTHHGAFDLAYLRPIPNLTISSPMNEHELRKLMFTSQLEGKGTFVIRYPRGRGVLKDWKCPLEEVEIGKGRCLKDNYAEDVIKAEKSVAVLTLGPIGNIAQQAIARVETVVVAHYDMRFLKPIDEEILLDIIKKGYKKIITIEDGSKIGGMGSAVLEWLAHNKSAIDSMPNVEIMGLPDNFVEHGSVSELMHLVGLDEDSIYKQIIG